MKPTRSILDSAFHYVPAVATSVTRTWRRFGWCPVAEARDTAQGIIQADAAERRASAPEARGLRLEAQA